MLIPRLLSQINLLPKRFEDFFKDDMFDRIMQEVICNKIYEVMTNDVEFMSCIEVAVKTHPRGIQFKPKYLVPPKSDTTLLARDTVDGTGSYLDIMGTRVGNIRNIYELKDQDKTIVETGNINNGISSIFKGAKNGIMSIFTGTSHKTIVSTFENQAKLMLTEYISRIPESKTSD